MMFGKLTIKSYFALRRHNDFLSIKNIIIRKFGKKYTFMVSELNSELYCL